MGNISQINIDGETHQIKDTTARQDASNALLAASNAETTANEAIAAANNKISKDGGNEDATTVVNFVNGLKVGSIPVSYNADSNTVTFG